MAGDGEKVMADPYTILHLYDGKLMNECQLYDFFNILVDGVMKPHEVASFDSYIWTQYHIFGDKLKVQEVAAEYLKAHNYKILTPVITKIDFSSERGE
jgi:hypothetical protein